MIVLKKVTFPLIGILVVFHFSLWSQMMGKLSPSSLYFKAEQSRRIGNLEEAKDYYKLFLKKYPKSNMTPQVLYNLAMILKKEGDLESALFYLKNIVTDFPKSYRTIVALREIIEILKSIGTMSDNLAYLDKISQLKTPYQKDIFKLRLALYVYYHQYQKAYQILLEQLKKDSKIIIWNDTVWEIIKVAGKYREFSQLIDKLYQDKKIDFISYVQFFDYFSDYKKELEILKSKAFYGNPYYAYCADNIARINELLGNNKEAIEIRKKLFVHSPYMFSNFQALLNLYLKEKDLLQARNLIFAHLRSRNYLSKDFLDGIVKVYQKYGYLEELLSVIDELEKKWRGSLGLFREKKAWIYFKLEKFDKVLGLYFSMSKNPESLSENFYQLYLSNNKFGKFLKDWIDTILSNPTLFQEERELYLKTYLYFLKKKGDIYSVFTFLKDRKELIDEDFLISSILEPYLNDIRKDDRQKMKLVLFLTKNYSSFSRITFLASYFLLKLRLKYFRFEGIPALIEKLNKIVEDNPDIAIFFDTKLISDFYFKAGIFYFKNRKNLVLAEKFLKEALSRTFTDDLKLKIKSLLYQIDFLRDKKDLNPYFEDNNLFILRPYFSGISSFFKNKMTSAVNNWEKLLSESISDERANDVLYYLYFKDRYLSKISSKMREEFLKVYLAFLSGKKNQFFELLDNNKDLAAFPVVRYWTGCLLTQMGKFSKGESLLKELLLKKKKYRYLSELSQRWICEMGMGGKLDLDTLKIELQTYLSYFNDSPYLPLWRKYLGQLLEEDKNETE